MKVFQTVLNQLCADIAMQAASDCIGPFTNLGVQK